MNKIKIENAVLCEDARQELGGKFTLLGVGGSELNISELPAFIQIAIWIYGAAMAEGPFEGEMRVRGADKDPLAKAGLKGEIGQNKKLVFVIGPMPLQIKKAGDYVFEWKSGNEKKWSNIATLRINYTPPGETAVNAL